MLIGGIYKMNDLKGYTMLLEFTCSNHKSILNEILFSTIAGKDKSHEKNVKELAGFEVLKASIIYGANGSGKSNFIDAITFVKELVINSINHQPGQGIRQVPHKLSGFEKNSDYKIQFMIDNIRYVFGFSLRNMLVEEEYLYYFPNGRQTKIFERVKNTYTAGNNFKNKFNSCKEVLKPNRLMLSCAANFSAVEEVAVAYRFFNNELIVYTPANYENWMNYSLYQINTNKQVKNAVLAFLAALGTGIKDIRVSINKEKLESYHLPPFLSDEFKNELLQKKFDVISAKVVYEKIETDLLLEESIGVRKLIGMLCPFIDIIVKGKVLICDELESSLHESIVFELVKQFINTDTKKIAQLIFTTHETGLLNLDLFRKDQIWFTEIKDSERATDLYSLAEIKSIRKEDNFGKGYISGKYGAIPMLNLNFANIISNM